MLYHDETWMKVLISPSVFIGIPVIWVFGVFALVHFMMTKKPVHVKMYMQVYNVVQILVCGYMVWGLSPVVFDPPLPNVFGVNSAFDQRGEWFVFVHYLSKYLDWFDTLWIVLSKKRSQLSFLHVYHHSTIVSIWGILLHAGVGSGTTRYGAWINSLTHVLMYTHYLWTSFGLKNPFKKYLTMWQIAQFYSCLVHAFVVMFYETTPVQGYAWIQVVYQISMVYLFSSMMSWVPACVPDFNAQKGEKSIGLFDMCSSQPADEEDRQKEVEWKQRYVVIRGEAYDITGWNHPGGAHMIDLSVGRDATVMFESAHIRMDVANKVLASLPKLSIEEVEKKGYFFGRRETWPTPSESKLYETIRKRVLKEVLPRRGHKVGRGVPAWHYMTVILSWLFAAIWFVNKPSILAGLVLGWTLAWIGVGVQHTANHGGLCANETMSYLLGLMDDIATGGSSIVWRYHHQVSHHAYCNDVELDPDAFSSFPLIRTDSSQQWQPYHRYQWLYAGPSFCFLWFSIQFQDLACLLDSQFFDVTFKGTRSLEILLGISLKAMHVWWLVVLPYQYHGFSVMLYPWMAVFFFGGFMLAAMFIVSHNVDETQVMQMDVNKGDWARQQIETSTSWGGTVGSFMTGGLNLQIEHHLFPCLAHYLYPDVQVIVKEECQKLGITYNAYGYLLPNLIDHFRFLYHMGQQPEQPTPKNKDNVYLTQTKATSMTDAAPSAEPRFRVKCQ